MKKYLKQLKANKKGFTLIEMIVVIAIIGILAAILVPSMAGYLSTAKDSRKEANAKTVYTAAQAAVTSLEGTKDEVTSANHKLPASGAKSALHDKIKDLIGESNYSKFTKMDVKVAKGAVISVTVKEKNDTSNTTYPQQPEPSDDNKDKNQ